MWNLPEIIIKKDNHEYIRYTRNVTISKNGIHENKLCVMLVYNAIIKMGVNYKEEVLLFIAIPNAPYQLKSDDEDQKQKVFLFPV